MHSRTDEHPPTGSTAVSVLYTETAQFCIGKIAAFLRRQGIEPKPILAETLQEFEETVTVFPMGCSISAELTKLGCIKYRECNTSTGYRVLYSFDLNAAEITAHIILSQRENVQQLLFDRMIAR